MKKPGALPKSITEFKGKPTRVTVTREAKDESDLIATQALLELYTQPDGFHCPRCGVILTNAEEAVYHLAEEINKGLAMLGK